WLNSWCYYRSKPEIVDAYRRAGFTFEPYELECAVHRLRYTNRGWAVPVTRLLPGLTRWGIEKLAGLVVLSRRAPAAP
ncbi:MAG TPA: hypothetical protein VLV16_03005, partial [Gemmatimonadales bacterium]|nr:hypothetical protein [Gemmatimonadales bacterium]